MSGGQASCKSRISGLKGEVKHLDQEIKKNAPELKKVFDMFHFVAGARVLMFS
jgi:hypothetical protein